MTISIATLMLTTATLVGAQAGDPNQSLLQDLISETGSPGAGFVRDCGAGPTTAVAGLRIAGTGAAITADDLWHLGSNTKAMTATLAARLVERGIITWDARLGDVLTDADLEIHPQLADATLEEFLSHRSGIVANPGLVTALRLIGADADRDLAADRKVYSRAVLGEPGGERGAFVYSNAGYVIAGLMLEAAAGVSYETLMAEEVFEPLGMMSAGWGPPGVAGEADQPRGHRPGLFGGLNAREPGGSADNAPAMNAAGRAHMTLQDLSIFMRAHLEQDSAYLSAASWQQLHDPVAGGNYALGWGVGEGGQLSHAGSNTMWFMQMQADPASGCVVAVAVNDGRIDAVASPVRRLAETLMGE